MQEQKAKYGIEGYQAPELDIPLWVDGEGNKIDPVQLSDYQGKFKVLYCFQSWCPGCHSVGLPALQKMTEALKNNKKVAFLAIQTVFEGNHANTFEKMLEVQKKYDLHIPFGHDVGSEKKPRYFKYHVSLSNWRNTLVYFYRPTRYSGFQWLSCERGKGN